MEMNRTINCAGRYFKVIWDKSVGESIFMNRRLDRKDILNAC